jgi:hypothetical protein
MTSALIRPSTKKSASQPNDSPRADRIDTAEDHQRSRLGRHFSHRGTTEALGLGNDLDLGQDSATFLGQEAAGTAGTQLRPTGFLLALVLQIPRVPTWLYTGMISPESGEELIGAGNRSDDLLIGGALLHAGYESV